MAAAVGAAESNSGRLLIASDAPETHTGQGGVRRRDPRRIDVRGAPFRMRGTTARRRHSARLMPLGRLAFLPSGRRRHLAHRGQHHSERGICSHLQGPARRHPPQVAPFVEGPFHSATAPISGAPGFDTSSTRKWNTGHWTLDEREKRSIPVTLSNRRDETETVIEEFHASRLQALRHLGCSWANAGVCSTRSISTASRCRRCTTVFRRVGPDGSQAVRFGQPHGATGWVMTRMRLRVGCEEPLARRRRRCAPRGPLQERQDCTSAVDSAVSPTQASCWPSRTRTTTSSARSSTKSFDRNSTTTVRASVSSGRPLRRRRSRGTSGRVKTTTWCCRNRRF